MQKLFIDTPEKLQSYCETIKNSQWLALDTEFIRERSYYPKFCLLQICDGQTAACIDPLQIDSLDPVLEIIYNTDITKVFHAAHQDLEIFFHLWGKLPRPIFDTQLAASITGHGDQIGYAKLVQAILKVNLAKDHSRTDWSMRPLDEHQLDYAYDDVIYLEQIYKVLHKQIQQDGRDDWLDDEYAHFNNPSTFQVEPVNAWKKVKGRQHLKGVQYAILQSLAAWREKKAINADRPRRWIMKDEVLVDLSKRMPGKENALAKIRGLEKTTISKHGETLLSLISEAKNIPAEQWPAEALSDVMRAAIRLRATENHITPSAIASRKDAEKLITGERDMVLLEGWRQKVAGEKLLKILNKSLLPGWNAEGKLILKEI
jgi:ribonuclease D